ncbi:MAG: hypothetical protein Q7R49_01250 [Candidatus Daviesbacteria bacterium]|nr:hypothetical protein [Candidatus Daviesbacteria bacterium]
MPKKTILLLVGTILLIAVVGKFLLFPDSPKSSLESPGGVVNIEAPSETNKTFTDPSGFSFSYPDNLSLAPNELTDATYAELQLSAKGVVGSLILKITDSKFKSTDEWAKSIKDSEGAPKETKLGALKALEVKVPDGLELGSVDQGVLFTIGVSDSSDFWMKVYSIILADFSFAPPASEASVGDSFSSDVTFDGEEVVE